MICPPKVKCEPSTIGGKAADSLKEHLGQTKKDSFVLATITEGRAVGSSYQWCGDAVTWALSCAGWEDPEAINRAAVRGQWRAGRNIIDLERFAIKHGATISIAEARYGDVYVIEVASGAHVGFVLSVDPAANTFTTLDGNSLQGRVAINVRSSNVRQGPGHITRVISVAKAATASCSQAAVATERQQLDRSGLVADVDNAPLVPDATGGDDQIHLV